MGRPRKIKTPEELLTLWKKYKSYCDDQAVLTHKFNAKNNRFVSATLRRAMTYTINGFCLYIGISRSAFYDTYNGDPAFSDIVTRIREECEVDAREKFELSILPVQLAGLWMSKHGYTTKTDAAVSGTVGVNNVFSELTTEELKRLANIKDKTIARE